MHGHICTCIIQHVHCPLCTLRTSCMVPLCNFHLFPQWDVRTSGTMWCQLWGRMVARGSRQGKAAAWTLSHRHPRAYGLLERLPHHCRCYSFLASMAQVCGTEQCCHITHVHTLIPLPPFSSPHPHPSFPPSPLPSTCMYSVFSDSLAQGVLYPTACWSGLPAVPSTVQYQMELFTSHPLKAGKWSVMHALDTGREGTIMEGRMGVIRYLN